jgi:hypothetical protein
MEFTSGKYAKAKDSLNLAAGHLAELKKSADALDNTSYEDVNKIRNLYRTKTGSSEITEFENNLTAVAGEMATVFKGTAGTDQEIQQWRKHINANQSPEQLNGNIKKMLTLMGERLGAIKSTYEMGLGKKKDFSILNPSSKQIFRSFGIDPDAVDPVAAGKGASIQRSKDKDGKAIYNDGSGWKYQ